MLGGGCGLGVGWSGPEVISDLSRWTKDGGTLSWHLLSSNNFFPVSAKSRSLLCSCALALGTHCKGPSFGMKFLPIESDLAWSLERLSPEPLGVAALTSRPRQSEN